MNQWEYALKLEEVLTELMKATQPAINQHIISLKQRRKLGKRIQWAQEVLDVANMEDMSCLQEENASQVEWQAMGLHSS